jgi:hypothetical protein
MAVREELIDFQGYRLDVFSDGLGWHVFIYAPGSAIPLCDVPVQPSNGSRDLVIRAAQELVQRHLSAATRAARRMSRR